LCGSELEEKKKAGKGLKKKGNGGILDRTETGC
jgi:hypothetical protein